MKYRNGSLAESVAEFARSAGNHRFRIGVRLGRETPCKIIMQLPAARHNIGIHSVSCWPLLALGQSQAFLTSTVGVATNYNFGALGCSRDNLEQIHKTAVVGSASGQKPNSIIPSKQPPD